MQIVGLKGGFHGQETNLDFPFFVDTFNQENESIPVLAAVLLSLYPNPVNILYTVHMSGTRWNSSSYENFDLF